MIIDWKTAFSQADPAWANGHTPEQPTNITNLADLKLFLDMVHIKHALLKPFCQQVDYPIVETRELLPSFETDLWVY